MNPDARRRLRAPTLLALSICAAAEAGCGSANSAPQTAQQARPATGTSESASAPEASASAPAVHEGKAAAVEPESNSDAPESKPDTPAAPPLPSGKDITYRMTTGGLVVELDGIHLEPKAEPLRLGGGWGVKLVVKAKAIDEREHRLQSPGKGPLMVAEEIDRGDKKELVPDERAGDGELVLEKASTTIERELRKPIVSGQTLILYVGLWGLSASGENRKPIKKLFVVKMVAGTHKPQPVVSAPE